MKVSKYEFEGIPPKIFILTFWPPFLDTGPRLVQKVPREPPRGAPGSHMVAPISAPGSQMVAPMCPKGTKMELWRGVGAQN